MDIKKIYTKALKEVRDNYNKMIKNQMNQIDDIDERYRHWVKNCINPCDGLSEEKYPLLYGYYWESNYEVKSVKMLILEVELYEEKEKIQRLKLEAMDFNALYII